uniref:Uncharacterized protein n=1 Tax=Chenopodium quinoa TaxID=63459 RepID=A0A803KT87_CHEQI
MPGIPLVAWETIQSRNGDQPCRQDSRVHLSAEEEIAAEESLSAYCKPVELYNILQRRARRNVISVPLIQMTVSLSGALDDGLQIRSLCPMYIILARALSDTPDLEHSAVYRYTKARLLTSPRTEGGNVAQVKFILPEMNKLVREAKSGSFILFVSYAGVHTSYGFDSSRVDNISLSSKMFLLGTSSVEKSCLWGKISMESLFLSWEKFPNLSRGERVEMLSTIDLRPCLLKVTQEYQAVNVSVKIDPLSLEIVADGVDPKQLIFFLCFKRQNRRTTKLLVDKTKHVQPLTLTSDVGVAASDLLNKADGLPQVADLLDQAWQLGTKNELFSAKSRALMEKRQFFHSHRAQPMALEQIFSEHDSEDEVDDDVADLEDRRMLDDFVDVSKDEKQIMHLWNSFVRKQRILADGHIPWACEAFSRLHGNNLVQAPALIWCWRLFMIKLWNLGLLDARTMNNCSIILEQFQKQETTPVLKAPPRSPI